MQTTSNISARPRARARTALGLVPWLVALGACAHPRVASPPPQTPELSAPGVPHASVATPLAGEPWRVDDTRVVWGGVRFEQRDETLEVAGGFAAPIIAAASTEAGWLFLTSDGLLARAEDFLGTPELIERWSEPGRVVRSTGRIVLARQRELWTSVGQRMERMALDVPVQAAAFRGDWGLVVGDDVVHETHDGGRSWSTLDLGGELALDVVLHPDGGFAVMRTDGPYRRRDGTWESASSYPDAGDGMESSERSPLLRAAAKLPYMRLDPAFLEALQFASDAIDEGCGELAFGGPFAFAYCSRADAEWWERRDGTRALRLDVADDFPPLVSLDGRTALWRRSPCGGVDPRADEGCALVDEQLVRVRIDRDVDVRGVGAGLALLERHHGDELWERLVLVDLRTGRESPLRFSSEARTLIRGDTVHFEHVAIHSDGPLVALTFTRGSESNQRLVLVAGDPSVGLRVRALPSGVAHATILPDGSAVAFGSEASDLFWAPGGGRFQRVALRVDGVVPYDWHDLSCGATTCRAGVFTIGTGPVPEPVTAAGFGADASLVGDTGTPFAVRVIPLDERRRFRLDCEGAAITAPAERSGAVRSAAPEVRASRRVEGGRARSRRGGVEGGVERWSWRVSDGPEQHAMGPASSEPEYRQLVARATRHYALVMRCTARGCAADVLREGRIERVPAPPWSDYAAVPLDDGGTLVVARVFRSGSGTELHIGWHFDASGRLAHRVARNTPLHLARWGGYGWAERVGGELVFTSPDGTERRASLPAHEGSDTCGNPLRDDALLVRSEDVSMRVISGEELAAFPWVELTPQRACVRSYELRPLRPLDEWPSRIEAHHGHLRLVQHGRPHVECRAP